MSVLTTITGTLDFHFRNLVLSAPFPWHRISETGTGFDKNDLARRVDELDRLGVTVIENFAPLPLVDEVRRTIDSVVNGDKANLVAHFSKMLQAYHVTPPLLLNDDLTRLAFDNGVIALIEAHMKRKTKLVDADVRRVLPIDLGMFDWETRQTADTWHYDNRGRQMKMMIYLSDVRSDDQNFAFCAGTHKGMKSNRLEKTRFSDSWVDANVADVCEVTGPAGTAVLFDTQVIHRLRRKNSQQRDSITFYYHAGYLPRYKPFISPAVYNELPASFQSELRPADQT